jgi:succinate dehydrogenase hydrophobic anchor subunit
MHFLHFALKLSCGIFGGFISIRLVFGSVVALVPHCHMGMEQVLMDYLHPRKFGFLGPLASSLLWMSSAVVFAGLIKLAFDGGVTKTLKQVLHA